MPAPLELDDFTIKDLKFHWNGPAEKPGASKRDFGIHYDVATRKDDPLRYRIELSIRDTSFRSTGEVLYTLQAIAHGFFTFSPDIASEKRDYHIRVNGLTILYGALRGALTSMSGLFPPNKRYVLPTVNMLEVIQEVEAKRSRGANEKKEAADAAPLPDKENHGKPGLPRVMKVSESSSAAYDAAKRRKKPRKKY